MTSWRQDFAENAHKEKPFVAVIDSDGFVDYYVVHWAHDARKPCPLGEHPEWNGNWFAFGPTGLFSVSPEHVVMWLDLPEKPA